MHEVRRTAITPYSADAMFELVTDVEAYCDFLPWCSESSLLSTTGEGPEQEVVAKLGIAQGPLHTTFTTRNRFVRPTTVEMRLVDGPFSELRGQWSIRPLGEAGSRLELNLRFAFSNPLKDKLLGAVFEKTCNRLVDAFVTRAAEIYG